PVETARFERVFRLSMRCVRKCSWTGSRGYCKAKVTSRSPVTEFTLSATTSARHIGVRVCVARGLGSARVGERPRDRVRQRSGGPGVEGAARAADPGELVADQAEAGRAGRRRWQAEAERAQAPDRLGEAGEVGAGLAGAHEHL